MRLTFLGTAAAEMYPAPFCNCRNCAAARQAGGKNIRGNSAAMVDDDVMIDMNVTSHLIAAQLGLSLSGVKHLLVTHTHPDHFAPDRLRWRRTPIERPLIFDPSSSHWSARYTECPELLIHGNQHVQAAIESAITRAQMEEARYDFRYSEISAGKWHDYGDFSFMPLQSNHGKESGFANTYIIRRNGKTLLYALDAGGYTEDQLTLMVKVKYDCVCMEGTFGFGAVKDEELKTPSGKGHMNLAKNRVMRNYLMEHGSIRETTPCILTHLCPHYTPLHDQYQALVEGDGFLVAFDGMSVII